MPPHISASGKASLARLGNVSGAGAPPNMSPSSEWPVCVPSVRSETIDGTLNRRHNIYSLGTSSQNAPSSYCNMLFLDQSGGIHKRTLTSRRRGQVEVNTS